MHRRVTVNGKTYVEPTGDIGTFSEFVSHTAVQIEIEVYGAYNEAVFSMIGENG